MSVIVNIEAVTSLEYRGDRTGFPHIANKAFIQRVPEQNEDWSSNYIPAVVE